MDDSQVVRSLHDLSDLLEERRELVGPHGAVLGEPVIERDALHQLHREPEQAVVLIAKRVDVGSVRVIEQRRELRFALEAPQRSVVVA